MNQATVLTRLCLDGTVAPGVGGKLQEKVPVNQILHSSTGLHMYGRVGSSLNWAGLRLVSRRLIGPVKLEPVGMIHVQLIERKKHQNLKVGCILLNISVTN
jgi:hypothetical protein